MSRAATASIHKRVENHTFMQEIRRLFNEEGRKSVTFVVHGISMNPFLVGGRDKVVLHRVIKIEGDTYTMQGDGNCLSSTEQFTEDKIVGIAEAFIRKGKPVRTDSRKWRMYSSTWKALRPFRRILLAIYRRVIIKIL